MTRPLGYLAGVNGKPSAGREHLACALIAVVVSAIAVVATASAFDGRITALVHMEEDEPMAAVASANDDDFAFVPDKGHYDGVYFYAIALDPLATGAEHELIDQGPYRYGHAAYGIAASVVSLGQASLVPGALLLISLASIGIAAAAASRISSLLGWSAWGGLAVALNPGFIYAVTVDTSEAFGAALLAIALLAWLREREVLAIAALSGVVLAKEPLVAVPVALALWEFMQMKRSVITREVMRRRVLMLAIPLGVFVLWQIFLKVQFGVWSFSASEGVLTLPPFSGWIDTLQRAGAQANLSEFEMQLGAAAVPILVALGAILVIGMVAAARMRTLLDPVFLLIAAGVFCLGWLALLYPKDLIRTCAYAIALLPAVLASASSSSGAGSGEPRPNTS